MTAFALFSGFGQAGPSGAVIDPEARQVVATEDLPGDEAADDAAGQLRDAWGLWRAGREVQAIVLADRVSKAEAATPLQRCEAWSLKAFRESHLRRHCEVERMLSMSDPFCVGAPVWLATPRDELRSRTVCRPAKRDAPGSDRPPRSLSPLEAHQALCERSGADSCLVMRDGRVLSEWYGAGYRPPVHMMSSTKSVSALLVGMLIDDGKIPAVDEPVCTYIPQWCEGDRGRVTIEHLLTQTSGLKRRHDSASVGDRQRAEKNAYVIGLQPDYRPGTRFAYSNEGVQLLSPILDAAAGRPIQDYARERLFGPLGMTDSSFKLDAAGNAWTYADMLSTPRDFARIGQLMLDRGVWRNRRIVSEAWIDRVLSPSRLNPFHGYLWWLDKELPGFATRGYLDTNMYVIPRARLVVVRTQSTPRSGSVAYEPAALELFRGMARSDPGGGSGEPGP